LVEEQTPQDLSHSDLLRGRAKPVKVLTAVEEKDDKTLLGSMYKDKVFLRSLILMVDMSWPPSSRSVFDRAPEKEDDEIKELSEEGFLFLTGRSDFWRTRNPIYVTRGDRETRPGADSIQCQRASLAPTQRGEGVKKTRSKGRTCKGQKGSPASGYYVYI